jgi:hypothetical protein
MDYSSVEQRRIIPYLNGLQAKVNALRDLQSASAEELPVLMNGLRRRPYSGLFSQKPTHFGK